MPSIAHGGQILVETKREATDDDDIPHAIDPVASNMCHLDCAKRFSLVEGEDKVLTRASGIG